MWATQGQVVGLAAGFSDKRRSVGLSGAGGYSTLTFTQIPQSERRCVGSYPSDAGVKFPVACVKSYTPIKSISKPSRSRDDNCVGAPQVSVVKHRCVLK